MEDNLLKQWQAAVKQCRKNLDRDDPCLLDALVVAANEEILGLQKKICFLSDGLNAAIVRENSKECVNSYINNSILKEGVGNGKVDKE